MCAPIKVTFLSGNSATVSSRVGINGKMITIYLEEHFLFPKKIIRKELLGRECTMKHLVPGYWECTCCLNAFVALYGSLLQATYVGSW